MRKNTMKTKDSELEALYEELERRYGPAMAQEIIDQINKANSSAPALDYMAVKALSEATELFRAEAQDLIKSLKAQKRASNKAASNILDLEQKRLEERFNKIFRLYWISMKSFYKMYDQALRAFEVPAYTPYRQVRPKSEQARAA